MEVDGLVKFAFLEVNRFHSVGYRMLWPLRVCFQNGFSECKISRMQIICRHKNKKGRKGAAETSWKTSQRGSDGRGQANSATFPIFAWHCHPCQLLNASVSQTSVQLASAPPLQGLWTRRQHRSHQRISKHLPGTTHSHKYRQSGTAHSILAR